jgi:S-adenosylmethionine:tRNA ribosyltransferase-isomerase
MLLRKACGVAWNNRWCPGVLDAKAMSLSTRGLSSRCTRMSTPYPLAPSVPDTSLGATIDPTLRLSDFDFELPSDLIAQHPPAERSGARLLDGTTSTAADRAVRDLPALFSAGDLLMVNDTRVIKARLFGRKDTGGTVELLVERVDNAGDHPNAPHEHTVWAHVRASKSPKPGQTLRLADAFDAEVLGRGGPDDALFHLRFPSDPFALMQQHGHVPLPPYITHADNADDERRYQTVFAHKPGAVAAPTAALHLDEALLAAIQARGVQRAVCTLHVGAGTFQPVRVQRIADHAMHFERFEVPQATVDAVRETRKRGGRVVAIGTTTVRALESAARGPEGLVAMQGDTNIFITPGFEFRVVDRLMTNFHLPKSTLLMLVSAFAGGERVRALYHHAVAQRYRFFSYGDAMLLDRALKP